MNADTIAALERALRTLDAITVDDESRADAALIRAHIETLRAGGERAQIVAWLKQGYDTYPHGTYVRCSEMQSYWNAVADEIAAGAHEGCK